ncbi:MAG: TrbG/VirB9 family P-type conjugative transfer protein [Hydrogenophaga sp.]|uniref:TrbG/VirB9 family P-type conjugative transfer protein n=1 Tax=Hydrogenophaga sp. TaxID=1904254 RepID=UPI0025B7C02C|nr:TrbG/VirB9 family P-type conjugative transfer protein [Hydrogenophaga sp.]MBT9552239.1 TrbG/VirB9 family P-type conjugative transfer protein [Hydrogenophaga sp.]
MKPTNRYRSAVAMVAMAASAWTGAAHAQEVREVPYRQDQVVRVNTGLGIATQIEISPQEQVKDFGTGFSDGWELVRRDNIFYIRPKNVDVDTNMYIRTNMRSYLLDLRVSATKWKTLEEAKSAGVFYKIRFVYGSDSPDKASTLASANAVLSPTAAALNSQSSYHLNYDYSALTDVSTIVPTRVYDNGQFTYIHLPPMANFPAVFGRNSRSGDEFVVNTKSEKNVMVVLGVYPFLVMRLGNDVVGLRRNP